MDYRAGRGQVCRAIFATSSWTACRSRWWEGSAWSRARRIPAATTARTRGSAQSGRRRGPSVSVRRAGEVCFRDDDTKFGITLCCALGRRCRRRKKSKRKGRHRKHRNHTLNEEYEPKKKKAHKRNKKKRKHKKRSDHFFWVLFMLHM